MTGDGVLTDAGTHDVFDGMAPGHAGRIGPNAVTRLAEALDEDVGVLGTNEIFRAAGQLELRHAPPARMVEEQVVTALHVALRSGLGLPAASRVARRAGSLTGDYLLAHRIPRPVRLLLHCLPAAWGTRLLIQAMQRHSWTFAGSGTFTARRVTARWAPDRGSGELRRARVLLAIGGCPLCRGAHAPQPVCDYFAATFERLFVRLIHSSARVQETDCRASGADACRFEVRW
jgi:divinyl protochlorophyllide a 8-vinyl-reductase